MDAGRGWRPWRRPTRDPRADVDDELRAHIDAAAAELEASGLAPEDARREALARFGDVETVRARCATIQSDIASNRARVEQLDLLGQDLRLAVRMLIKRRGFSALAILILALGIGANTAIFSIVNGILLRTPPGIARPERLVEITQGRGDDYATISYPVFEHLREHTETLEGLATFDIASMSVRGERDAEVVLGLQVSGNFFEVLGASPALGSFFRPEESFWPGLREAVVLGHDLWVRQFDADPGIVGRALHVNGTPLPIIGVAAPGAAAPMIAITPAAYVLLGTSISGVHGERALGDPGSNMLEGIGRLAEDVEPAAVQAELEGLATAFLAGTDMPSDYPIRALQWAPVPGSMRGPVTLFFAALMALVGLLQLIACFNVSNMMLSSAAERRRELAIRLALGASRSRLVRQMLTEGVTLVISATLAGVLLATWLAGLLVAFEPPIVPIPGLRLDLDFGLDGRVLLFSVGLAAISVLTFGLAPALRSTRPELVGAIHDAQPGGNRDRVRLRGLSVGTQMATTVVLLIGTGLFLRALGAARGLDTGFETGGVEVAGFELEIHGHDDRSAAAFYAELLARARTLPGVETAAVAGKLPLAGASRLGPLNVDGVEPPAGASGFLLDNQSVSAGYFATLQIPLLRGRDLRDADIATSPPVAVINETMARRFWGDRNPVGERFWIGAVGSDRSFEVVGVVADARYHRLIEETPNFAYFPYHQRPRTDMFLHLRGADDGASVLGSVRRLVDEIDPTVPVVSAGSLSAALAVFLLPQRLAAWVTGVVGAIGLLLCAAGVYAITAFAAARRQREIGVRMAVGAHSGDVIRLMVRQGMRAPALGIVIGVATAAALSRVLGSFLAGVNPLDPLAFGGAVLTLAVAAIVANWLPARRAARLDPSSALRTE